MILLFIMIIIYHYYLNVYVHKTCNPELSDESHKPVRWLSWSYEAAQLVSFAF